MLAHTLDFDVVGVLHANRSAASAPEQSLPAELRERFYVTNADDVELYRFARALFDERWREAEPAIAAARRPLVPQASKLDVREFLDAYTHDLGGKGSFLFERWSPDDPALTIFWGVLYRTGFLPLCFRLLEQLRLGELDVVLDNLARFHAHVPYAQPVLGRCIAYFERCRRRSAELGRPSFETRLPVLSVDYVGFLETDRMLQHGRSQRRQDLKAKIERALLDD